MNPEPKPLTPGPGYEVRDAQVRVIAVTAAVLAAGIIFSLLLSAWYYHRGYMPGASPGLRQSPFSGSAAIRTSIAQTWPALDREVDENLQHYGWIDRPNGVVRIPIERAMERIVVEAGAKKSGDKKP
jgi:hypothetical protein